MKMSRYYSPCSQNQEVQLQEVQLQADLEASTKKGCDVEDVNDKSSTRAVIGFPTVNLMQIRNHIESSADNTMKKKATFQHNEQQIATNSEIPLLSSTEPDLNRPEQCPPDPQKLAARQARRLAFMNSLSDPLPEEHTLTGHHVAEEKEHLQALMDETSGNEETSAHHSNIEKKTQKKNKKPATKRKRKELNLQKRLKRYQEYCETSGQDGTNGDFFSTTANKLARSVVNKEKVRKNFDYLKRLSESKVVRKRDPKPVV